MRFKALTAGLLALAIWLPGYVPAADAQTQLPKPSKTNADEKTLEEFRVFYEQIEKALQDEDVGKIMTFYADDYLHHGITKKQLKFMWLEVFGSFADPIRSRTGSISDAVDRRRARAPRPAR